MTHPIQTVFLSISLIMVAIASASAYQGETTQSTATNTTDAKSETPKLDAFLALRKSIRSKEMRIDEVFGDIPIGFPKVQQEFENQLAKLEKEANELRSQLKQATIDAYLENPNENRIVNTEMLNTIKQALNPVKQWHRFSPNTALEVSQLIIENGIDSPQIQYFAYKALVAINEFDRAEALLNRLRSEQSAPNDSMETTLKELQKVKDKWIREQELRINEKSADNLPRVKLVTTRGEIIIELFEDHAPQTVANFISLVEKKFYDNQIFHLVQPGKYAQTGCPDGNGRGGPGYKIHCECYRETIREHFAGSVSMSHPPETKDTADSKFFILQQPDSSLDGKYTVFGRVLKGMDTLYALNACDKTAVVPDDNEPSKIISATVSRKRNHIYSPTPVSQ